MSCRRLKVVLFNFNILRVEVSIFESRRKGQSSSFPIFGLGILIFRYKRDNLQKEQFKTKLFRKIDINVQKLYYYIFFENNDAFFYSLISWEKYLQYIPPFFSTLGSWCFFILLSLGILIIISPFFFSRLYADEGWSRIKANIPKENKD